METLRESAPWVQSTTAINIARLFDSEQVWGTIPGNLPSLTSGDACRGKSVAFEGEMVPSSPKPGCVRETVGKMTYKLPSAIQIDLESLAEFGRRNPIRRLALFGSVLRRDFRPTSDVDMLVEFEPDARVGLIRLAGLEQDLTETVGRKVDLRTPADLSRYFREQVLNSAEVVYERV